MERLTTVVREWTQTHIRRNLDVGPTTTKESTVSYIESLTALHNKPTMFLSTNALITNLWSQITADPVLYDFVVHGTTYMEIHGFSSIAHRNSLVRAISDALRWGSLTQHTTEEFKKSTYSGKQQSGTDALLEYDPWLIFITIFQNTPLEFEQEASTND